MFSGRMGKLEISRESSRRGRNVLKLSNVWNNCPTSQCVCKAFLGTCAFMLKTDVDHLQLQIWPIKMDGSSLSKNQNCAKKLICERSTMLLQFFRLFTRICLLWLILEYSVQPQINSTVVIDFYISVRAIYQSCRSSF